MTELTNPTPDSTTNPEVPANTSTASSEVNTDGSAQSATAPADNDGETDPKDATPGYEPGQKGTFQGKRVEITAVHADDTLDFHELTEDGTLKMATSGTGPIWHERQAASEFKPDTPE